MPFNSDIVNYLLKTTGGEAEGLFFYFYLFIFFVVWSALIAGGYVVVAWSRKYCLGLAEIACFVSGFIQGWGTQSESNISFFCF